MGILITLGNVIGGTLGNLSKRLFELLTFWSLENTSDYYASLEDGSAYYSLTSKDN